MAGARNVVVDEKLGASWHPDADTLGLGSNDGTRPEVVLINGHQPVDCVRHVSH